MLRRAALTLLGLVASVLPASAHHEPGLLGHHWEVPDYANELRFQIGAILCIVCLTGLVHLIRHAPLRWRRDTK